HRRRPARGVEEGLPGSGRDHRGRVLSRRRVATRNDQARSSATPKLGRLAPAVEPASGNGNRSHPWKSVCMADCHPAGPVGTLHWYTRNPATHAAIAIGRTDWDTASFGGRKASATNTPNSGTNTDPRRNRNDSKVAVAPAPRPFSH